MMPPAILDDPVVPAAYPATGEQPYSQQGENNLPDSIFPRPVTLRDRITTATLLPASSPNHVPPSLLSYLTEQLNQEIDIGDTYPMIEPFTVEGFGQYWFKNFGAIMVLGDVDSLASLADMERNGADWSKLCLGSFYVKPNWPGRSSHVCTGGFLVTDAARNKGVGRLMGEGYLDWAPRLGYSYSIFNLVYETNLASCRIWDALGFKRIGKIKGAGALKSHPEELTDAIIYGRDLGPEGEDFVSEERFEKIRYYLKNNKYPAGADRAEKSRLRSAATHYKLLPSPDGGEERLMLKDKEVVSDPQRQYEIARQLHAPTHGGINKTTASIAERYHWVRIKETVSLVIRNCQECKDTNKTQASRPDGQSSNSNSSNGRRAQNNGNASSHDPNRDIERLVNLDNNNNSNNNHNNNTSRSPTSQQSNGDNPTIRRPRRSNATTQEPDIPLDSQEPVSHQPLQPLQQHPLTQQQPSIPPMQQLGYDEMPLDPQIMSYASHGIPPDAIAHALDHRMAAAHHHLSSEHGIPPHTHHPNLANLNLTPHGIHNDPSSLPGHGLGTNLHNVNQNMHGVEQGLGHAVDHHAGIHVNMNVINHNGFAMGLAPGADPRVGVSTDDRMDADGEDVGADMSHHLMEAGFGGPNHGGN